MRWLVLGAAGAIALGLACWYGIAALDRAESDSRRRDAAKFLLANTICGAAPARIKTHNASWSFGPWIEVFCKDGTTRAIQL